MSDHFGEVNARARGLASHLPAREQLRAMLAAPDLPALVALLDQAHVPLAADERTAPALELAVRRWAARELATLARRLRNESLRTVIFADEERRSVRAMLRGVLAGAPAAARLAGLIPTPALPERLLEELAAQPDVRGIAALLVAWRHPCGPALLEAAVAEEPDLLHLELALGTAYAARIRAAGRDAGRAMRRVVEAALDLENVRTALLLAGRESDLDGGRWFLEGGRRVPRAAFAAAMAAPDAAAAAALLGRALGPGPLAQLLARHAADPAALDEALAVEALQRTHAALRTAPLGPAPLRNYLLRLRAVLAVVSRAAWSIALGLPPDRRTSALLAGA